MLTYAGRMRAIVQRKYGPPDTLRLEEIERPEVGADDVLVRVRAAGINPADWHMTGGTPFVARLMFGLRQPKQPVPGTDVAGVVEAVGTNVTAFKPGDEIFGARSGSLAEYVAGGKNFLPKPANVSFEQAGAVAIAGCTALQGLRDKAHLQSGQRVLTPVIDRTYPLGEAPEAMRYLEAGHARGKVVVTV